jgi:hypothetical protein
MCRANAVPLGQTGRPRLFTGRLFKRKFWLFDISFSMKCAETGALGAYSVEILTKTAREAGKTYFTSR